jgi:hypothetical protein
MDRGPTYVIRLAFYMGNVMNQILYICNYKNTVNVNRFSNATIKDGNYYNLCSYFTRLWMIQIPCVKKNEMCLSNLRSKN